VRANLVSANFSEGFIRKERATFFATSLPRHFSIIKSYREAAICRIRNYCGITVVDYASRYREIAIVPALDRRAGKAFRSPLSFSNGGPQETGSRWHRWWPVHPCSPFARSFAPRRTSLRRITAASLMRARMTRVSSTPRFMHPQHPQHCSTIAGDWSKQENLVEIRRIGSNVNVERHATNTASVVKLEMYSRFIPKYESWLIGFY